MQCLRDPRFDFPVKGEMSAICRNCLNRHLINCGDEPEYCYSGNRINGCCEYTPDEYGESGEPLFEEIEF